MSFNLKMCNGRRVVLGGFIAFISSAFAYGSGLETKALEVAQLGTLPFSGAAAGALGWQPLPIGAGGQLTGVDIQCDQGVRQCSPGVGTVTKVVRVDTYGAWYFNPSTPNCGNANRIGCWQQVVTPASMPRTAQLLGRGFGVYEIRIAPSNTSHWYMYGGGDGCVYSTINKGANWIKTGFTCVAADSNAGTKIQGPYMAVDPANENIVLAATPGKGSYITTNGGTSWSLVSGVGIGGPASGQNGGTLFGFDPSSKTSGGATQGIYACTYGKGVYHSIDGGASWASITNASMPTFCYKFLVDLTGVVWATDQNNLYRFNGSWTKNPGSFPAGGYLPAEAVAVDTNNCSSALTCHIAVVGAPGQITLTTDGGSSWSNNGRFTFAATDVPWLGWATQRPANFMNTASAVFDPTIANTLEVAGGIGYWRTNPVASGAFVYTSFSAKIEQMVSNWITSPPGGNPIFNFWDRAMFVSPDLKTYPSVYAPSYNPSIIAGWSSDYVQGTPSTIVVLSIFPQGDTSGISTDGGMTSTKFTTLPDEQYFSAGGSIAASTRTNFMIAEMNGFDMYYTSDAGSTWNKVIIPGVPVSGTAVTVGNTPSGRNVLYFSSYGSGALPPEIVSEVNAGVRKVQVSAHNGNCGAGIAASATSNTITLAADVPSDCTVAAGDKITFKAPTGWGGAYYTNRHILCADRHNAGVFYAWNFQEAPFATIGGLYKTADGGVTWIHAYSTPAEYGGDGFSAKLECVPDHPGYTGGNMYFTVGPAGGLGGQFYEIKDVSGSAVTPKAITIANGYGVNVTDVWTFGFGKAKAGGSGYPAVYFYGSIDGRTLGYYQTYDHFQTVTKLGGAFEVTLDTLTAISGDMNTQGLVYACFSGSSCYYGQFN